MSSTSLYKVLKSSTEKVLCGTEYYWTSFGVVFLWWCGDVFEVGFLWGWCFCRRCFRGGVFVMVWLCFCGGVVFFLSSAF